MKAEIRRVVGLLPLMLLSMALLSLLVQGSGVLAYRSFQSPTSPPPTVLPSPTAVPPTETPISTPAETPTATATEVSTPTETPQPLRPTETLTPGETPLLAPTPTFEAAPPAAVASLMPSAEESPSQPSPPSRSWADYIEIGLVALAYAWRALGVLALIVFLGFILFLAIGRWRS